MFKSFILGGFECSTGINVHGQWFDQVRATQHDRFLRSDYALLRSVGIEAAREGIRWPLVDRGGFDFSTVEPLVDAARDLGIELIYDLFHFGFPCGLDLFSDAFSERFAEYCYAVTRFIAARSATAPSFTPINEPSFLAWAAGEAARFAPHCSGRGWELKVALARAAIAGIDAIWSACPEARIVNVDAVCRVAAPAGDSEADRRADHFNTHAVFESWDMLSGRLLPELGGGPRYLGMIGMNYYWNNQWELDRPEWPLADDDPRRWALRELIASVWKRYNTELLISETSHVGAKRASWLRHTAAEAEAAIDAGVPLRGVCIYPILGMPEWHARNQWALMGLWDLIPQSPSLGRVPHEPAIEALQDLRRLGAKLSRRA